jgi:hypothetical protein
MGTLSKITPGTHPLAYARGSEGTVGRGTLLRTVADNAPAAQDSASSTLPTGRSLLKKIAARQAETARARDNYTYRQVAAVGELDGHGALAGEYREVRDITFTPKHERFEDVVEKPRSTLKHLILTDEDFADIRNIQPFMLMPEQLFSYEHKFQGEETMDGEACYVVFVRPRQILSGQRFFEGTLWVRKSDFSVVRSEGQAVPQIQTTSKENLFPHFTTLYRAIDGKWFFPVETMADDTLYFRGGPQRIRVRIHYSEYKRFGAESTIQFGEPK